MEQEIKTLLKEYGLDNKEIKVFLYLVGNKELTAYRIAKVTKINRSTCYDVLNRLVEKGFVNLIDKKSKSYYSSNELSRVISHLKDKESILLNIMPQLHNLEQKQETKVRILEDTEGQKQFDFDLFTRVKNKEISFCYIIGNTYSSSLSSNIFIERLIKEVKRLRLNKKVEYRGIWDEKFKGNKIISQYINLGENRFLNELPSKVGTVITDNFVAFLYTVDKPYVVEVKNKLIAKELKSYFDYLWEVAKE